MNFRAFVVLSWCITRDKIQNKSPKGFLHKQISIRERLKGTLEVGEMNSRAMSGTYSH